MYTTVLLISVEIKVALILILHFIIQTLTLYFSELGPFMREHWMWTTEILQFG